MSRHGEASLTQQVHLNITNYTVMQVCSQETKCTVLRETQYLPVTLLRKKAIFGSQACFIYEIVNIVVWSTPASSLIFTAQCDFPPADLEDCNVSAA